MGYMVTKKEAVYHRGGLRNTQFIRWVGMVGRGKVGRDWGGLRNT